MQLCHLRGRDRDVEGQGLLQRTGHTGELPVALGIVLAPVQLLQEERSGRTVHGVGGQVGVGGRKTLCLELADTPQGLLQRGLAGGNIAQFGHPRQGVADLFGGVHGGRVPHPWGDPV